MKACQSKNLISALAITAVFGFIIYSALYNYLEVNQFSIPSTFNSRSLMNHGSKNSNNNPSDAIPISGFIRSIDEIITSFTPGPLPESGIKKLSEEIARQITEYVTQKFSQNFTNILYESCWRNISKNLAGLPVIYVVTPTYRRPEQVPELIRLGQTLLNVPAIHWIVVEDNSSKSPVISQLLSRYGIPHTHLYAQMPERYTKLKIKPRGVSNRNAALEWIRANVKSGVIYFADDDNTYDIEIFEEMRYTKKVSMWPVGLVTKIGLSSPIVNGKGVVVDFFDGWIVNRKFPVDMAGFAINVQLLLERPGAIMPYIPGYEEDGLLRKLGISKSDIEPKANNCTKILVWHTQTKKNPPANKSTASNDRFKGTNIELLQKLIV